MPTAIADFVKYVRTEVPGCPEPLIEDAVMRTCIDFCTRTELLSEIIELVTSATLPTYVVTPSDADLYPARLRAALKNGLPLDKTDVASYALRSDRSDAGSPLAYFAPTRAQITFAPIPNAAETIELDLVLRPARDATDVPDVLYEEWVTAIAAGAKGLLLSMEGQPWANAALAAYHQNTYHTELDTASVEVASGNVGAAMHVSPSPI